MTTTHPDPGLAFEDDAPRVKPQKSRAKYVFAGVLVAASLAGGTTYALSRGLESTDDAQVEGRLANVSARVPGQVKAVLVKDNQAVNEGDVLALLDDDEYAARLAATKADLAAARAAKDAADAQLALVEKNVDASLRQARGGLLEAASQATTSSAGVAQASAQVDAARAKLDLAKKELDRESALLAQGAISEAIVDTRRMTFDAAKADVDQAEAMVRSRRGSLGASAGAIELAQGHLDAAKSGPEQIENARAAASLAKARVEQAEAANRLAEIAEDHTTIRAPIAGVVTKRSVEIGQMTSPERPMLTLVPLDDVWVVASFKEDQIGEMRPGQIADVKVDTFPGRTFHGHLDSIAGSSGSRSALLPPDNASGNFVKVVQRVPVLVRLDATADVPLRPGLSADVTVHVK